MVHLFRCSKRKKETYWTSLGQKCLNIIPFLLLKIVYCLIGAAIFTKLERPSEEKFCEEKIDILTKIRTDYKHTGRLIDEDSRAYEINASYPGLEIKTASYTLVPVKLLGSNVAEVNEAIVNMNLSRTFHLTADEFVDLQQALHSLEGILDPLEQHDLLYNVSLPANNPRNQPCEDWPDNPPVDPDLLILTS